jgi:alpha-galactosidase
MMGPSSLVRHPRAGRLDAERVALRWAEPGGGEARVSESVLVPGATRVGPFELAVRVDAREESAGIDVVARNVSGVPLRLDAIVVGLRWVEHGATSLRWLRHGWQSWSASHGAALDSAGTPPFPSGPWLRGMFHALGEPPPDREGWHESHLLTAIGASPSGPCCVAGVLERGRGLGVLYLCREREDVRVELESWLERPLEPGESAAAETVRAALGDDAAKLLEEQAEAHGRLAGARTRAPFQAGWCSWYHFFHDVSEADVLRNLEALTARRDELPVTLVQLDDGYQRAIGDWLETNAKFPRGLGPLAAEIRAAGFRAGLWTAPFCVAPESRLFAAHRDWLLRQGDEPFRGLHHATWSRDGWIFVLDTSRPEVATHLRETFAALVGLGFHYQKLDFLYTAAMRADSFEPRVTRAQRLRRGLHAVRAGCGEETFLLGCGCPLGPAVGVVDGMRIGPDVAPWWGVDPSVEIPGMAETQPSTRNALRNVLARCFMHRRLWLNDPDCLMSRREQTRLTLDEARSLAAVTAVTGGMVLFSDDVPKLAPESVELVDRTIALAREVDAADRSGEPPGPGRARVLGLLQDEMPTGAVARARGGVLVALLNASQERQEISVDLGELVPPGVPLGVEAELGTEGPRETAAGAAAVALAPHASSLFRLRVPPPLAVFCDFDGTFAVQDVGSTLARRYAGDRRPALWARLQRGELTAWEYNLELLDRLPVPEHELEAFLRTVELDPGARRLVAFCETRGIPFRILSDGFDRNLERLQEIHGLRFAYEANRLRYEGGRWRIEAVQPDPSCHCGTGNCKARRIQVYREENPGVRVVHIGNGRVSDLCGAEAADLAFAKGSLAAALAERGRPFERFETLHDVVSHLEALLEAGERG